MRLTPSQEESIRGFMRECGLTVGHLPAQAREQVLVQLRQGLRQEIHQALSEGDLSEDRLRAIFSKLRVSENGWRAPNEAPKPPPSPQPSAVAEDLSHENEDAVLLGVCDFWAERWDMNVDHARIFMCALGALTGPLAVLVYLAGYAEWQHREGNVVAALHGAARPLVFLSLACLTLFGIGQIALAGMKWIYHGAFQKPLLLSEWGLLESGQGAMLAGAWLMLAPLSMLNGLPVLEPWRRRIQMSVRGGLAVYGIVVAYEIAYALTGFMLRISERL